MFGYVHTGLNIVHVADVAQGHVLAAEKGVPGQRYILGNRNMTLREIFETLARITGRRAPRLRVPYGAALAYACLDEWIEGRLLRRTPRACMDEVRHSRLPMYFDAAKARRDLGLPQTPVEQAFAEAVAWFRAHGYA
jgi:dihydroflavonol-4-reductase